VFTFVVSFLETQRKKQKFPQIHLLIFNHRIYVHSKKDEEEEEEENMTGQGRLREKQVSPGGAGS